MRALLADRFVALGRTWIDIASGAQVRLRFAPARRRTEQMMWSDGCAERARLRHPLLNALLDYDFVDNSRTFEAYSIGDPIGVSGRTASRLLEHAARFLQSRGLPVPTPISPFALREVSVQLRPRSRGNRPSTRAASHGPAGGRIVGVILQPRQILERLTDCFETAVPGGTTTLEIAGGRGSGIRTARVLAARAARVAGFVTVASSVLVRLPWLRGQLLGRHLCVLQDDDSPADRATLAAFLSRLGTCSARRHVLLTFTRSEAACASARQMDSMGIAAMTSMVFVDGDNGPSHAELFDAARGADGRPGLFLDRLHATECGAARPPIAVVHESSPAYVFQPSAGRRSRGVGRVLRDAPERGLRLAARGRHASAVRLLARASRVLEGRGERALAAECAEQLAWIDRNRGRVERALEAFERARTLRGEGSGIVAATIGIGVTWTDQRRLREAEACLRSACAASDVLGDTTLKRFAYRALARCLYWQTRYDEAAVALEALVVGASRDRGTVHAWALLARTRAATGDVRAALSAAGEAVAGASRLEDPGIKAAAFRSMAIVQRLVGDTEQVRCWSERALGAAASAHLPLAGIRARCLLVEAGGPPPVARRVTRWLGHLRSALARRPLPALLRVEVERCVRSVTHDGGSDVSGPSADPTLRDLEALLECAHGAPDDRTALEAVCRLACERLRASSVLIVSGPPGSCLLARSGRPWQGDNAMVTRVLAGGGAAPTGASEPLQWAEPVRYSQEAIAVLCCRWTLGTPIDAARASGFLRAAALAAAASVRNLLDRPAPLTPPLANSELLGSSEAACALRAAIERAARAPFPVLVEGESGSGKELVARGIHRLGPRRDRRLCTVNCAALSDDLLEAELFGHARGAYTGAVGERPGLFEEADGGTIFLDEIGELSPRAQAKLLRVLQDGEVRRVGENTARRVDARVVAATNRRLDEEVAANRFRADLRFRLDVVRIVVPPLRERASDIPTLAVHFWDQAAARVGTSATPTAETLAALARYDWPGNIRELQNVIASLAVHAPRRGRLTPAVLPVHIARCGAAAATTFESARFEFERRFVRAALAHAGGQRARAARALGVSRQGLAKMLRRLQLDESAEKSGRN